MRALPIIVVLALVTARGEDSPAPTMRQKLHAQIVATTPVLAPSPSAAPTPEKETIPATDTTTTVVMEPFKVSDYKRDLKLEAAVERKALEEKAERFSPGKGGTIYATDRFKIGGWWDPKQGWSFLNFRF